MTLIAQLTAALPTFHVGLYGGDLPITLHPEADSCVVQRRSGNQDLILVVVLWNTIRVVTMETAGRSTGVQTRDAVHRAICAIDGKPFTFYTTIDSMELMAKVAGPSATDKLPEQADSPVELSTPVERSLNDKRWDHRGHVARKARQSAGNRKEHARSAQRFAREAEAATSREEAETAFLFCEEAARQSAAPGGNRDGNRDARKALERARQAVGRWPEAVAA